MHKDPFIIDGKVFILEELGETGAQITIREYEKNTKEILELENLIEQIRNLIQDKESKIISEQNYIAQAPKKKDIIVDIIFESVLFFSIFSYWHMLYPDVFRLVSCFGASLVLLIMINLPQTLRYLRYQKAIKKSNSKIEELKSDIEKLRNLRYDKSLELERLNAWAKDITGMKKSIILKTESEQLCEIKALLEEEQLRREPKENEMKRVRN